MAPARKAPSFMDEPAERLLLGQVVVHPERFVEVATLDADALHGLNRELLVALHAQHKATDAIMDVARLRGDLFHHALAVAEEWRDAPPLPLASLRRRLEFHAARRRAHVLGATLTQLSVDGDATPADFFVKLRELAEQVDALADEGGGGK
jgi:hypothetical protein